MILDLWDLAHQDNHYLLSARRLVYLSHGLGITWLISSRQDAGYWHLARHHAVVRVDDSEFLGKMYPRWGRSLICENEDDFVKESNI